VKFVASLLLWTLSAVAAAATVSATRANGDVGVRIDALPFPQTFARELESGLTNRLYLRVSLLDGQSAVQTRTVEIAIRYDLWEETFMVTRTVDHAPAESQKLASQAAVAAYLASLRIPRLFALPTLPANRDFVIRVELLLNPIDREKLRMIRKWVAENSTPSIGTDQGVSTSNTVFNRIFEQYADGSDVAAEWRIDLASPPFRTATLGEERIGQ
jgi:hypothetical protein